MSSKMNFQSPVYFHDYITLDASTLSKNVTTSEQGMVVYDFQPTADASASTIAVTVSDGSHSNFVWKHLIHTIEAGNNIEVIRNPLTGIATISTAAALGNALCYNGTITESRLDASGRCWLPVAVKVGVDYWTIHIYRYDGVEVFPNVKVQSPGSSNASHFEIDFNSVNEFREMAGISSGYTLYAKVLIVNEGVAAITPQSIPFSEEAD